MDEPQRTGRRGWRARRTVGLVGLLLLPLVCLAHACVTVWLYHHTGNAVRLLLIVPFLLTLVLLACTLFGLWFLLDGDDGHDGALATALGGLMFAYLFAYMGAEDWMLRWQGTGTTCTVRGVEERQEWILSTADTPDSRARQVTAYDYETACEDPAAPGGMTAENRDWEVGDRVDVRYDPSAAWGSWGVAPAEELEPGNDTMGVSAGIVTLGTGVWTLSVLGCAVAVGAVGRSRRMADGPVDRLVDSAVDSPVDSAAAGPVHGPVDSTVDCPVRPPD